MDRLQQFFEYQVEHHPDNIALICNDIALFALINSGR